METIKNKEEIYAIIYRENDWKENLNFITPNELSVQVGSWWYQKGKILQAHSHKKYERTLDMTHEMVYVKKGSMKVTLYDNEEKEFSAFVLNEGDTAILAFGGHGYEILENDTQIIEAKNGPFLSVELDKIKF